MDIDPLKTEVRRVRREDRLGKGAVCVLCGEPELECLTDVSERLIEGHHPVGKAHEPDITVPVCQNCHLKLHEQMRREGADLRDQPTFLERLLQMLRSLAALFVMIGEALSRWAQQVERLVRQLDRGYPEWRMIG